MTPVAVQEAARIVAHNVLVTSPVDVQQLMQQRYDQGRPGYVPLEFRHPIAGVLTAEVHDLMVTYTSEFPDNNKPGHNPFTLTQLSALNSNGTRTYTPRVLPLGAEYWNERCAGAALPRA
ncbi:uncharacterized protein ATNIH1004_005337 [Aspergillus tanneri]|uniref:Uncharacterized protein n=1 Tax=Aspergillus tanneri TaxID=1220188 RepID=A0A5M9MI46_9EURO|nr:uncharacterized protein ATNIH1004_005337 [Aspergillus tanneri]KAA8646662.1 hypothetical protein ATNIH1004_005337 [Aspergillus tanneri]